MYDHDWMDDMRKQGEERRKEERIKAQVKAQLEAMKPDPEILKKFTDRELFMEFASRSSVLNSAHIWISTPSTRNSTETASWCTWAKMPEPTIDSGR
jgi:hypothetical protein